VVVLILLLPAILIFWGYRRLATATESIDLGVKYTHQDYDNLVENIGIDVEAEKLCLDCPPLAFSNPHEIEITVLNEQASAAFDIVNEKLSVGSISNSQIRFSDGYGELSTIFTYKGRNYPVYILGSIEKETEQTISGQIDSLKVGGMNIPNSLQNYIEEGLVNLANERMATMGDTFKIDEVDVTANGLNFKGMVPTKGE
jgi:hypothetical protein